MAGNFLLHRLRHRRTDLRVIHRLANQILTEIEVVNGEDDSGIGQTVVMIILPVRLRDRSRLPIVAVNDVRLASALQHPLQRRD